jgi:hypothetical protein
VWKLSFSNQDSNHSYDERLLFRSRGKAALRSIHFEKENNMDFLNQLLRGIAFVPALVNGIEGLFGNKSGSEKKDAAMSFLENALQMSDAIAQREIVNADQFREGVSRIIDGVVECMNASAWAKTTTQPAGVNPQK